MWFIEQHKPTRSLPVFCPILSKEIAEEYRKSFYLFSRPIENSCKYNHYEVPSTLENAPLFMVLSNCVSKLNEEVFKYDVDTIKLHYCSVDPYSIFPPTTPFINLDVQQIKLAFIINLNDNYEGGMTTIGLRDDQQIVITDKEIGTLSLFPSFSTINVNPPLEGRKDFILGYCYGPPFK